MTPDRPTDPGLSRSDRERDRALGEGVFDPLDDGPIEHARRTRRGVREAARSGHVRSARAPRRDASRLLAVAFVCLGLAIAGVLVLLAGR